ncbi:MAG: uracil-DNA glycosylase [Anaerolineales bacterium]|nr:uracil-DNA glycosylase [Anaerolineales bacterium]
MTLDELNTEIIACRRCPRLVAWREEVAREKRRAYRDWDYWGKPVPGFGDSQARVFVVGLAPGAHGSNRTGRQFTGDASGDFLYPALHRAGFASQPDSVARDDGLILSDLYTAPVCRCAPPANKPTSAEIDNCLPYLGREIELIHPRVFVALGRIAFDNLLRVLGVPPKGLSFAHAAVHELPQDNFLVCSYHPSRQNTQTGRLTAAMFDQVWRMANMLLGKR